MPQSPTLHGPQRPLTLRDGLPSLRSNGGLQILRVGRKEHSGPDAIIFSGTPGASDSTARSVEVRFVPAGTAVPAPSFDVRTGRIHLSYDRRDHPDVIGLLNNRGARFCYFWRSADGTRCRGWLLITK
ncbi:MAG: hypothetical protein KA175_02995 [Flavobacteriales bacterium]|nr:hypothetical protein [Flavobacteriales bacterium]MBP6696558.1 hypothetical protein [Flavobacteriales bacterium]